MAKRSEAALPVNCTNFSFGSIKGAGGPLNSHCLSIFGVENIVWFGLVWFGLVWFIIHRYMYLIAHLDDPCHSYVDSRDDHLYF